MWALNSTRCDRVDVNTFDYKNMFLLATSKKKKIYEWKEIRQRVSIRVSLESLLKEAQSKPNKALFQDDVEDDQL